MQTFLLVAHILMAFSLIGLILVQHGKGADAGAAFGAGASSTVFGARGAASFLTRMTAAVATLFFANSFLLHYLSVQDTQTQSFIERMESKTQIEEVVGELPALPELPADGPVESDIPLVPDE